MLAAFNQKNAIKINARVSSITCTIQVWKKAQHSAPYKIDCICTYNKSFEKIQHLKHYGKHTNINGIAA